MSQFKVYVVRYNDEDMKHFIRLDSMPRDLYSADSWKRNKIKSVHVMAATSAFVASSPDRLRELMLPLSQNVTEDVPRLLAKRQESEEPLGPTHEGADVITGAALARKHENGGFEAEIAKYAR